MLIKTNENGILRDLHSKALIFKNDLGRMSYKEQLKEKKKIDNEIIMLKQNIEELRSNINGEINELKQMCLQLQLKEIRGIDAFNY